MMDLAHIGISHHTAPVEVRERIWLSEEELRRALRSLKGQALPECVLVSTCNRTELYAVLPGGGGEPADLQGMLLALKDTQGAVGPEHLVRSSAEEAVSHLFAVASGIDSMVIGDVQILGQVKEAFLAAGEEGTLGPILNRLMQSALHVAKRVRTETAICEGAVSVSYAAVELAGKIFADLSRKSVLLIGAGETGELTLKHLAGKGIGSIRICNRTMERAEALAAAFQAGVLPFEALPDGLREADIVIISVSSSEPILKAPELQRAMKLRANTPLFIIDIGVPRNVDPAARKIDNVFLYDIDALNGIVNTNLARRKSELPRVREILTAEVAAFTAWHASLEVTPTITAFREAMETIRSQEVHKHQHRFTQEDRELLDLVTKRIVNKILHQPTTVLKQSAEDPASGSVVSRVAALRELFGIGRNGEAGHE